MSKLTAQGNNQNKQFKPKIYHGKRRGQTRNYYDQGIIKIGIDQIVEIGKYHSWVEVSMDRIIEECHNMSMLIEVTLGETILEECKIIEVKILEVDIELIIEMTILEEVEVDLGKDNTQIILNTRRNDRSSSSRSRSGLIILLDCPNLQTQKEPEQIQQMYNLDEDQTALKVLAADTHDNLIRTNSDDTIVNHLNL